MKFATVFFLLLSALLAAGYQAQAQSFLTATDDAYVRGGQYVSANFDTATGGNGLRIRASRTPDNWRKAYIKFDLSGYSGAVGNATLSIWVDRAIGTGYNAITNPNADTVRFYKVADDSWSENTVTWNNAPVAGDYLFTQAFRHRISSDPDTMYTWDVTSYVRENFEGDKLVTFLLADADPASSGAGLAIDSLHGTDLRLYSLETPFFEPILTISETALPSAHLISPNGGENWVAGTTQSVTWSSELITTVKLEYSTDNGSSWAVIADGTPASGGSYSWTLPNTGSTLCKVRVSDSSNAAVADESDGVFTITGPNAPEATTVSAALVSSSAATLRGTVTPRLSPTTAWFEWGTGTGYGYKTSAIDVAGTSAAVDIEQPISGLLPSTVYHFRVVAQNGDGKTYGADAMFTTASLCSGGNCFTATDDAFVRAGQFADVNYDEFTNPGDALRTRMSLADSNKRVSYLKFDLSSYAGTVGSVKLALWVDRVLGASTADTASIYAVSDDDWSESSITWNGAPARGELLRTQLFRHRISTDPDTLYLWDVTDYVTAELAGDKTVSFLIAELDTMHTTDIRMYSHETAGFEPVLLIEPATAVEPGDRVLPEAFRLDQNYPNPFNPSTLIRYSVPVEDWVRLEVFDLLGRKVALLVDERQGPGAHSVAVDASQLVSGVYLYRLSVGTRQDVKRMMVIR